MHTRADYCNEHVAKKVAYEFRMFTFLGNRLHLAYEESTDSFQPGEITLVGTATPTDEEEAAGFALLESFLLHTRVLRDFFFNEEGKDDDVVAIHFIDNWAKIRPQISASLSVHRQRHNKALAHLSLKRLEYERTQTKWNVSAIQEEIDGLIALFKAELRDDRKPWFEPRPSSPG